ncbi:MAG TPA: CAP domain-containing protein [Nannocystaceae bacterium]|nr:CAP domain-containing protein [Nannocystaceae bacterium]
MRVALAAVVPLVLGPAGCVIDELTEDDVGTERYCDGAHRWPVELAAHEDDLIDGIAALRRSGATCDDVRYNPVTPLELVPELHCAARLHATDLAVHDAAGPDGSDGSTPLSRANLSGYDGIPRYEMTAANFTDADAVLAAWIAEPIHCTALLDRKLRHFGVGHSRAADDSATAFVLELGEPRS